MHAQSAEPPLDEVVEGYVTAGVEPACPFTPSAQVRTIWTSVAAASFTSCAVLLPQRHTNTLHISLQACVWTAGCSVEECNDKCAVQPQSSFGINLPDIVDEQLLNAYACPNFAALVRT